MIPLSLLYRIDQWLRDHMPVVCVRCQRLMTAKTAKWHSTTTGVTACLCQKCENEIYTPWGK